MEAMGIPAGRPSERHRDLDRRGACGTLIQFMDKIFQVRKTYDGGTRIEIVRKVVPSTEAELAIEFIARWGMVAAEPDGEDTAGRQKLKPMSPEQVVDRALRVAELACQRFEEKGWYLHLPEPTPPPEEAEKH